MSTLLTIEDLSVDLPVPAGVLRAVRGISIEVSRGEMLAIVGESGCGKSLTSLAIMGLLPKGATRLAAKLDFAGIDLAVIPDRKMADIRGERIGMIFQEPMTALNPCFTVGSQLEEVLVRHRGASRKQARDRAIELLEIVGITPAAQRLSQFPHQLSGGLRQRVMIAMALMCEPELLICDEPTTALDVTVQSEILSLINRLRRDLNMAVILITHDLGVVARAADRLAVMYAGQIVESGTVRDVFATPLHPYTQGLLACIPVPGRTAPGERLGSIPGVVPSIIGEARGCSFRNRCSLAFPACGEADIPSMPASHGGDFRCLLDERDLAHRVAAVGGSH
ncbi:MAG: ABC transporter ATP-binding protein [Salinarimonadaceae bacterium]|nr:MAG: ABC transporter ATP-binding protein [Salinarimonadaceae bacterium]